MVQNKCHITFSKSITAMMLIAAPQLVALIHLILIVSAILPDNSQSFLLKSALSNVGGNQETKETEFVNMTILGKWSRWPGGIVPYVLYKAFIESQRNLIRDAMDDITAETCVQFVPRTRQVDYVYIATGQSDCFSNVGRVGGMQKIIFSRNCLDTIRNAQRQLMYILGFYHEHTRPDRDQYVYINWDNIREDACRKFNIERDMPTFGLPYDYESLMHYGPSAFAKDKHIPTIIPLRTKRRGIPYDMGHNKRMSRLDVTKIKIAYCSLTEDAVESSKQLISLAQRLRLSNSTMQSLRHSDYVEISNLSIVADDAMLMMNLTLRDRQVLKKFTANQRNSSHDIKTVNTVFNVLSVAYDKDYIVDVETDLFYLVNSTLADCVSKCSITENCEVVVMWSDTQVCTGKPWTGPAALTQDGSCDTYYLGSDEKPGFTRTSVLLGMDYLPDSPSIFCWKSKSFDECRRKCLETVPCFLIIINYELELCCGKQWMGLTGFQESIATSVHFVGKTLQNSGIWDFLPPGTADYDNRFNPFTASWDNLESCIKLCAESSRCDLIVIKSAPQICIGKNWEGIQGFFSDRQATGAQIYLPNGSLLYGSKLRGSAGDQNSLGLTAGLTIGLALLLLLALVGILKKYNKQTRHIKRLDQIKLEIPRRNLAREMITLEVPSDNIVLCEIVLGKGQFGIVYKGVLKMVKDELKYVDVAIKVPLKNDEHTLNEFHDEISLMGRIQRHLNIVNILAINSQGELQLVMEYCCHGSLRKYLRSHRGMYFYDQVKNDGSLADLDVAELQRKISEIQVPTTPSLTTEFHNAIITTKDLISYAYQVARGMVFLSRQAIIHRDLASRNILVCDNNIVKVSDFGMAIKENSAALKTKSKAMPLRWMAPESIRNHTFSQKSDVWSYGILLWEIFSLGDTPHKHVEIDGNVTNFLTMLETGCQLDRPQSCPTFMYETMRTCWQLNPSDRPTFDIFRANLQQHNCDDYYLVFEEQYQTYNAEFQTGQVSLEGTV